MDNERDTRQRYHWLLSMPAQGRRYTIIVSIAIQYTNMTPSAFPSTHPFSLPCLHPSSRGLIDQSFAACEFLEQLDPTFIRWERDSVPIHAEWATPDCQIADHDDGISKSHVDSDYHNPAAIGWQPCTSA